MYVVPLSHSELLSDVKYSHQWVQVCVVWRECESLVPYQERLKYTGKAIANELPCEIQN